MSDKIGALWVKTAKSGLEFMSGEIELNGVKHKIVVFKNQKQHDKQPDYTINLSKQMENNQQKVQNTFQGQQVDPWQNIPKNNNDNDIPF